jgi:hypothetical protein
MTDKPATTNVADTLAERGARYGKFNGHAAITQEIKASLYAHANTVGVELNHIHSEAIDMICHKLGRIVNGDPNSADSWHDIAGYAKLVEDEINGKQH